MSSTRFSKSSLVAILLAVFMLASFSAGAANLNVAGGQLMGATGVIVDGSSYNVAFLDGTCIALYDGCDDASDFTFQTAAAATLASQALLDQVFLDGIGLFDSNPALTNGLTHANTGSALTPYYALFDDQGVAAVRLSMAVNLSVAGWGGKRWIGCCRADRTVTPISLIPVESPALSRRRTCTQCGRSSPSRVRPAFWALG